MTGGRPASFLALAVLLSSPATSRGAPAVEVRVAAASDLKFAMDEIAAGLSRSHPGVAMQVTYGSSGNFFSQIAQNAPFDVFFSADMEYVRQLADRGLVLPDSTFLYAIGRIVIWVPRSSRLDLRRGLPVLADPAVARVAIANPRHAPYGRAAEAALRSAGVYDAVKPKLVFGENVSQAAQFVQTGAVDAGIIALSLARAPTLVQAGRHEEIPESAHPRLQQGAAILKAAGDPVAARVLCDFVRGPDGRAILRRYGFLVPD